jgi:hypothetical protein
MGLRLERLSRYVNCTFPEAASKTNKTIVVLINSDEKDQDYRTGVAHVFDAWDNIHIVDFDNWLKDKLDGNTTLWPEAYRNNFHLFHMGHALMNRLPLDFKFASAYTVRKSV